MLAPSCLILGPCWPHVVSNLAQVGPMLGPIPNLQLPLSRPWANPSPSRSLPRGLLVSQTPTTPQMDIKRVSQTQIGVWQTQYGTVMGLPSPQLEPESTPISEAFLVYIYVYIYTYIYIYIYIWICIYIYKSTSDKHDNNQILTISMAPFAMHDAGEIQEHWKKWTSACDTFCI